MRAREFVTEQRSLPPEASAPMRHTYVLPGLSASDPYKNYRMGVAMARARIENPRKKVHDTLVPCALVTRRSTSAN